MLEEKIDKLCDLIGYILDCSTDSGICKNYDWLYKLLDEIQHLEG